MLLFKGIFILSRTLINYCFFACRPFSIQLLVCAHPVCLSSSKLSSVAEYLVLVYGGCLNSLLPSDFIPLTSDNLFLDRSIESFEFLETYNNQWQVLLPSIVLGIHQCPLIDGLFQVFDLNTFIHTCQFSLQCLDSHFHYRWVISHLFDGIH